MKRTNLVLMISAALTLAACGGNSSNDSAPSDPTPPKTAQPTPKPAPTPETSEQEAEKPEAKKPATGGSSGGSGGSYAGGGSYGGGGSSGGSSGSTGGDTGGGDTGDTGDTGGGDETGDTGGGDDTGGDTGGEETVKELTDEQIQEFANSGENSFVKAGDEDLTNKKAVKVGDKWNGYYLKSEKTEENPNPAEIVLMPTAESNTETVKTTIKTAEQVRKWGDIETATTRVTQGETITGTDYLSKAYSYSRFGIKVDGKVESEVFTPNADGTAYYSVGDIGSLIPNASEPPANGEAEYLGVAFLNATDGSANTIGTFKGHAKFSKKEFEGSISGLRTYETLALLAEGKTKKMEDQTKRKFYGEEEGAKKIKFTATIDGHHLVNKGEDDAGIKINGAFYGPEAAEVGGVISGKDDAYTGAFGGEKIKDAAPTE